MHLPITFIAVYMSIACSKDSGSAPPAHKPRSEIKTDDAGPCVASVANNQCKPTSNLTPVEKCWKKILETPEYTACASAGKMFNRVLKKCVESGIKLKSGCTIPSQDQKTAQDRITAVLGAESNPALDQCGSYTAGGKEYMVAYFIGKKCSGTENGFGTYAVQNSMICYKSSSGTDATCSSPDLLLAKAGEAQPPQQMSCE
jgi:hypothetical protein